MKEFVDIQEDEITIYDKQGEIVKWTKDEWEENPDIVLVIVNAVKLSFQGIVRKTLETY